MKKSAVIGSTLAAIIAVGSMSIPAFAASNPADDASTYSYNTGKQSYEARMAEEHPWFDNEDEETTANYSFNAGSQAAQARNSAFAEMPTGDDLTDEELDAFFQSHGIGNGAAYANGEYDETLKSSYGYVKRTGCLSGTPRLLQRKQLIAGIIVLNLKQWLGDILRVIVFS